MRKRFLSIALGSVLLFGALGGCAGPSGEDEIKKPEESEIETKTYELSDIEYEKSATTQSTDANCLLVTLDKTDLITGETLTVTTKYSASVVVPDYSYYLIDWGDGTWSYYGPCEQLASHGEPAVEQMHQYREAGTYAVRAAGVCMQNGELRGWSNPVEVEVTGEPWQRPGLLNNLCVFSSESYDKYTDAEKVLDNNNDTVYKTTETDDSTKQDHIGMLFDGYYSLRQFEVKIPVGDIFPYNIAVEITMDGGKTWLNMPKYYYVEEYNQGMYSPIMKFPNPNGATLSFQMDGAVANGIRFVTKMYSYENPRVKKYLNVSEMRVYGDKDFQFESSMGDEFDATVNNLWITYGTTETEPLVNSSKLGENSLQGKFKMGLRMIGSTEWDQYSSTKYLWSTDADARDLYIEKCLLSRRYGDDGWSNGLEYRNGWVNENTGDVINGWTESEREGYIWATNDGALHLGLQRHYVYNSIFISCMSEYLMQGNYESVEAVMNYRNAQGQTVIDRLEKAMEYQLKVLQGENGLLIITDPQNDGTEYGNSSNLWDAYKCFGYKSSYENIFFYRSIIDMAEIYELLGDKAKQQYYTDLAATVKQKFNETFWDDELGRYISGVNVRGQRLDFGHTFVNFYAIHYGLADQTKADRIHSWLSGDRIIETDTSQGEDIYGFWQLGARTNTVNMDRYIDPDSAQYETGPWYIWDHNGALDPTDADAYGENISNGGFALFFEYYDIINRIRTGDGERAMEMYQHYLAEYRKDRYKRSKHFYLIYDGLYGPELGMLALVMKDGYMGMQVGPKGVSLTPQFLDSMEYSKVNDYIYQNRMYCIEVNRNCTQPKMEEKDGVYYVTVPATGTTTITPDNDLVRG